MTITRDSINLTAALRSPPKAKATAPWQQLNLGTGNGALVSFALPKGWKSLSVHQAGLTKTEGTGNDYTVTFDGFIYSVLFAVAPAIGNVILVDAWRTA